MGSTTSNFKVVRLAKTNITAISNANAPPPPVALHQFFKRKLCGESLHIHNESCKIPHYYSSDARIDVSFATKNDFVNTALTAYIHNLPLHIVADDVEMLITNIATRFLNQSNDAPIIISELYMEQNYTTSDGTTIYHHMLEEAFKETCPNAVVKRAYSSSISTQAFQPTIYIGGNIPKIYLDGSGQQWDRIRSVCNALMERIANATFTEYITTYILPIIDAFNNIKNGIIDEEFLQRPILRQYDTDECDNLWEGWLLSLIPIITNGIIELNDKLTTVPVGQTIHTINYEKDYFTTDNLKIEKIILTSGFMGVHQLDDGSIRPIRGYEMVIDDTIDIDIDQ